MLRVIGWDEVFLIHESIVPHARVIIGNESGKEVIRIQRPKDQAY